MSQGSFKPIYPNPYIVGNPIRSRDMFFGRVDEFRHISQALDHGQKTALIVLFGERRSGKSSILYQIQNGQLGQAFLPLFIDLQIMAGIANEAEFFGRIITDTGKALGKAGPEIAPYILRPDDSNPAEGFRQYLRALQAHFPGRALLVLIDEYEILENKITEGCLSRHVLTFFGGLLESEQVSFVFTGSRKLELHNAELWGSALLQKATSRKISFLTPDDTARLVTQPLANKVTFAPEVIEQIYALTAGQPFYTQLICQNLVYHLNEVKKYFVDCADLEKVVEGILENPPPQLIFNWGEHAAEHKLMLALLAEFSRKPGRYLSTTSIRYRVQRSKLDLVLNDAKLKTWLTDLCKDEYLLQQDYRFSFRLDLFRRWIRHDHNIWQVKKEIGQEELDRICEREREKKEKKKKIIIVLERVVLVTAIVASIYLLIQFYNALQKGVKVTANGGPFMVQVDGKMLGTTRGQKDSTEFIYKENLAGLFSRKKLTKGFVYVFEATLLAPINETRRDTVEIKEDNQEIRFAFQVFPVTIISDASRLKGKLGGLEFPNATHPESWHYTFSVTAGKYPLGVWNSQNDSSPIDTVLIIPAKNDTIVIDFPELVVFTLKANFPYDYQYTSLDHPSGGGTTKRRTANLPSEIIRGFKKGKYSFTFYNPANKRREVSKDYLITANTTIAVPSFQKEEDKFQPVAEKDSSKTVGRLTIVSNVDSTQIFVNDTLVGYTPSKPIIRPRHYVCKLTLKKSGYDDHERNFTFTNEDNDLSATLNRQRGHLKLYVYDENQRSVPDAKIYIDQKIWGEAKTAATEGMEFEVGSYEIEVERSGFINMKLPLAIKKGGNKPVEIRLRRK